MSNPVPTHKKLIKLQIRMCEKYGKPYTARVTNGRIVFKSATDHLTNMDSQFPSHELQFIKSVKQYIIKNETFKKVRNTFKNTDKKKRIKYFFYNKNLKPGDEFTDCWEVDLDKAFWITLYELGVISKEIFEKGMHGYIDKQGQKRTISKKSRLAAVGTVAKSYRDLTYDGKELHIGDPVRSELTEFLWDTVCYKTGALMSKAMRLAKSDFLFFWVDALFIRGKYVKEVKELFRQYGYGCSVTKCEYVRFEKTKIIVKSTAKGKWKKKLNKDTGKKERVWVDTRPFPYKRIMSEADINNLINGKTP